MDIADDEEVRQVVEALAEEAGGIDVLVNCAGIFKEAFFLDMTPKQWKRRWTWI